MRCIYKNNLKIQHFRGFVHSSMALVSAHPLWPVSALHSLSSSSRVNGACLHISINPCSLTRTPGHHHNRLCTYLAYNINKQNTDSNKVRNPRFRDKAHESRSDRANTQRGKYPRKEVKGESQRLPWDKQSSSANRTRDALKTLSKTAVKDRPYPEEQSMPFYPSRGGPGFGSGLNIPTAPWMQEWSNVPAKDFEKKNAGRNKAELDTEDDDMVQTRHFDGGRGISAMHRIVDRIRNLSYILEAKKERDLNAEIDSPDQKFLPNSSIGSLLEKSWGNMDSVVHEDGQEAVNTLLPWERGDENAEEGQAVKPKRVRAPTLAELTIPDPELRRLRTLGIKLKERINVKKAGLTQNILDKIHDSWKTSELVRLKFDEPYLHNMKRAHQLAEDKTGGLVIWRAGSVLVLYRGSNYEPPSIRAAKAQSEISSGVSLLAEDSKPFIPDIVPTKKTADPVTRRKASEILHRDRESNLIDENIHVGPQLGCDIVAKEAPIVQSTVEMDSQKETNDILDGLGPRFIDWWGNDPLPVDADLLPEVVPNYKTPFRLLPYGTKRSKLSNQEMTNLRKLAKPLPIHFALGRNRRLQGLAAAILKIWERCEIAKIAVKRGVQNTNNKLMAEELKKLTGGVLLLRNKFFIIIYRGKDFLPPLVATVLAEKAAEAKVHQDEEEIARSEAAAAVQARADVGTSIAGTLAETFEAEAKWMMDSEEQEKMRAAAAEAKRAEAVRSVQRKLAIAQLKKQKAEKDLAKLEVSLAPVEQPADQEAVTNEEKFMFRKLGLRMKAFLLLGRRGVFDGVVENMHLHWKHRELVKILSKGISRAHVEDIARMLEYESGGILVTVEKVSKEYAIIVYRGKNYQRPTKLRPTNLLNKRKALKRSIEIQRQEALSFHISQLEKNIKQLTFDLSKEEKVDEDVNTAELNVEVNTKFANKLLETEDEDSESEPSYYCSENEDISSEYESEMDAMESVQAETGTEEHEQRAQSNI